MTDRFAPTNHFLARHGLCGNPFHGLVTGGQLALPNATQKAWPQPTGSGAAPDRYGATTLVEVPGVATVTRTPEQLAADAERGWEWRADALLSGAAYQLYSEDVGGWIYIDPAGVRWKVQAEGLEEAEYALAASPTITVSLIRFGSFGKPFERHDYDVQITDWGQSGADYLTFDSVLIDTVRIVPCSISKTGDRAVLMLHKRRASYPAPGRDGEQLDLTVRWPIGYLELEISGAGAAASLGVSVLRTRGATVKRTLGGTDTLAAEWYWYDSNTVTDFPVDPNNGTVTYSPELIPSGAPDEFGPYAGFNVGVRTDSITVQHLITVWINPNSGSYIDVFAELAWTRSGTYPSAMADGGALASVTSTFEGGVCTSRTGDFAQNAIRRTVTETETLAARVRVGGVVQTEVLATLDVSSEQIAWARANAAEIGQNVVEYPDPFTFEIDPEHNTTFTGDFDGQPHSAGPNGYAGGEELPPNVAAWLSRLPFLFAPQAISLASTSTDWADAIYNGTADWVLFMPVDPVLPSIEYHGALARQSSQLMGYATRRWESGVAVAARPVTYQEAATPTGAHGTPQTVPFVVAERRYASWNAATGAVSWMNTAPVCWV